MPQLTQPALPRQRKPLYSRFATSLLTTLIAAIAISDACAGSEVSTFAGGGSPGGITAGHADGAGTAAIFNRPQGIVFDKKTGNFYVTDAQHARIRKISASGVVTTLAGDATAGQPGQASGLDNPFGIAIDSLGNLFVADTNNNLIRKISPTGAITTFAGNPRGGYADGSAGAASFTLPKGIAIDSHDNLYVADTWNNRIRKITPAGVVTTFAGSGWIGHHNDGKGKTASFTLPHGIVIDRRGNLFVADTGNHAIRKITPAGIVSTFFRSTGKASAFVPGDIAIDDLDNLYVADYRNHLIRKISPAGIASVLAGGGNAPGYADGAAASFNKPTGITIDGSGKLFIADTGNNLIRKIPITQHTSLAASLSQDNPH